MKNKIIILLMGMFLVSSASSLWAGKYKEFDFEEEQVKPYVKELDQKYRKIRNSGIEDYAGKEAVIIENYLKEAKKQIVKEEWDSAYAAAGKAIAYINYAYKIKRYKEVMKQLKKAKAEWEAIKGKK